MCIMGLFGLESLVVVVNVFIGQIEVLLVVWLYLEKMSKLEIFCFMMGGMVIIVGSVFVVYVGYLGGMDEEFKFYFVKYLFIVLIIFVLVVIVVVKIFFFEMEKKDDIDKQMEMVEIDVNNLLDVIFRGMSDGLCLVVNVGVMFLVFMVLIFMMNEVFLGVIDLVNIIVVYFNFFVGDWND